MDNPIVLLSSACMLMCSSSAAAAWYFGVDPFTLLEFQSGKSNAGSSSTSNTMIGGSAPPLNIAGAKNLPLPSQSSSEWNIRNVNGVVKAEQGALKVTYLKGKYTFRNDSGAGFGANPFKMFPSQRGGMGCKVFVPNDFDFKKGGKLGPGVCIGACATGGDYKSDGGSARLTFEEGGAVHGYVYVPTQVKNQTDAFENEAHRTGQGRTGDRLFGTAKLNRGQWNSLAIGVDVGGNGKSGRVDIWVNGKREGLDMVWTTSNLQVTELHFSTFFGGNDSSYAPTKDQSLLFKDFFVF